MVLDCVRAPAWAAITSELPVSRVGRHGPHGATRNHRAHSDDLRAHAGHREACLYLEARWSHPERRHAVNGAPGGSCEPLVGHVTTATNPPSGCRDRRVAVAATATGIAEK